MSLSSHTFVYKIEVTLLSILQGPLNCQALLTDTVSTIHSHHSNIPYRVISHYPKATSVRLKVTYWLSITSASTIITSSPLKREFCLKYLLNYEELVTSNVLTKILIPLS